MTHHLIGTTESPEAWAARATADDIHALNERFDAIMERMRLLQRKADAWLRQAKQTKDGGTKRRLAGQARQFQKEYSGLGTEFERLQACNSALQLRMKEGENGAIVG